MKKIMLCYPPGKLYQRGEDRSQGNIEDSSATAMRACNDLGYAASVLLNNGYNVFLKDYQTEKLSKEDLFKDIVKHNVGIVSLSVTNATIFEDIKIASEIKIKYGCIIILKGSIFYDAEQQMIDILDLSNIDYLIGGEIDSCIGELANYIMRGVGHPSYINNIYYKDESGRMTPTRFHVWNENLDDVPFPARQLMNNKLYVRPDTGEPMATIQISRGCPANCIYCLSPTISGKRVRYRSAQNVFEELLDCYDNYGIKNFFFKADTFTINANFVKELCSFIINSKLNGKIAFTANSRVRPLEKETLMFMKEAGCFAVAFGFESGNQETLDRIRKGTTVEDNRRAIKLAREAHIPVYGFYMIGFPWETQNQIDDTIRHIFENNTDYIEIHIALPYYGTELYNQCKEANTLIGVPIGNDYFNSNTSGTQTVQMEKLNQIRKKTMLRYYLRLGYIIKKVGSSITKPYVIWNYFRYGLRLLSK